jgi:hypothetical protein
LWRNYCLTSVNKNQLHHSTFKKCITRGYKMNIKMLKAALAGLVLSVSSFANAGLITLDFDAFESGSSERDLYASPFITQGFQFTGNFVVNDYNIVGSGNTEYTGSAALSPYSGETHTLQQTNGSAFDLISLDFTELKSQLNNYGDLLFIGNISGGDTVSQIITPDKIFNIQNVNFSGFTNLVSVMFTINVGENLQFDNIVLRTAEVPEPTTLAIFALGIMGLASRRFKKK